VQRKAVEVRAADHISVIARPARHSRRLSPWLRHASVIHSLYLQRVLNSGTRRDISNSCRAALALGCSAVALAFAANAARAADYIQGGSLLISTTTYQDAGAVANLVAGTSLLPGANAGETSTAVSNGALNTVWNNASVDSSFGVTSAISLSDLNINTGAVLASTTLNPNIVSTSFSSKSELGLNLTKSSTGYVATFMGYAGGGVGNLDVSNSDTTAFKDTTNPVTSFFAPGANQTYAFNRSVVAFSANGSFTTTQTLAYGGNNGRSAVLAPNGLYYTTAIPITDRERRSN
jgi:hypothetical protein